MCAGLRHRGHSPCAAERPPPSQEGVEVGTAWCGRGSARRRLPSRVKFHSAICVKGRGGGVLEWGMRAVLCEWMRACALAVFVLGRDDRVCWKSCRFCLECVTEGTAVAREAWTDLRATHACLSRATRPAVAHPWTRSIMACTRPQSSGRGQWTCCSQATPPGSL